MAVFAFNFKAFVPASEMIKWFLYIVLLMISAPRLLSAKNNSLVTSSTVNAPAINFSNINVLQRDTTTKAKQRQQDEDKKKIKEVAKAKKQPKPEKLEEIDPLTGKPKTKPKRQRRPDGLERPPEIPRRNDN